MGAKPWHFFVPYRADINSALQDLREQEFRAGHYGLGALLNRDDLSIVGASDNEYSHSQKSTEELIAEHGSVEAAIEAVLTEFEFDGTSSILDILWVSDVPETCAVSPVSTDDLFDLFKTDKPTREVVESILIEAQDSNAQDEFWGSVARGEGRYILIYKENNLAEIFFAGYSFD